MLHVILLKSRIDRIRGKVKVKVPVHLESGKVVMGYRYKGLAEKKIEKREKLVKDVPVIESDNELKWIQRLVKQKKIEEKLVSPESNLWGYGSERDDEAVEDAQHKLDLIDDKIDRFEDRVEDVNIGMELIREKANLRPLVKKERLDKLKQKKQELKAKIDELKPKSKELEQKIDHLENKSDKSDMKAPLEGHLPHSHDLKMLGEKAIRKALRKVGLSNFKKPGAGSFTEDWYKPEVRDWQDDWADNANDNGTSLCDILHYAVASRLPEGAYAIPSGMKKLKSRIETAKNLAAEYGIGSYQKEMGRFNTYIKAANVVVDVVYQRTQKILSNLGYSRESYVYLYRGMDVEGVKKGRVINLKKLKHNPLSSWSFDPETAEGFGKHIFVTKVKVKDIVSVYMTGLGCSEESEVLIPAHVASIAKVLR